MSGHGPAIDEETSRVIVFQHVPQNTFPPAAAQTRKANAVKHDPQQIKSAITPMKRLLILAICTAGISTYALPTYEPFTEYSDLVTASGSNSVSLATSGFYVTNGPVVEQWGGGSSGFGLFFKTTGIDVLVTNNSASVFTTTNLASILPSGFPGAGSDIYVTTYLHPNAGANTAGNSAVFKFAQDIPRPTSGVKTIYVSYLMSCPTKGAAVGAGNAGRYAGFLSQTNIFEGTGSGGDYSTWGSMFNTYGASVDYVAYGQKTGSPTITGGNNILASDSAGANSPSTGNPGVGVVYNTANFVVGCFTFSSDLNDTNAVWVNPPVGDFGGATPSSVNFNAYKMSTVMSDVGALFLESRSGGALGGVSPTFIGNLLIGTTWSYVTGGPEFTNNPTDFYITTYGTNLTLSGSAVAAAQNVTYQWQRVVGGSTNNLTDGTGTAGGTAVVSGSQSQTLNLSNISTGDMGQYQLLATASGTGFSLAAPVSIIQSINPNPTTLMFSMAGNQLTLSWPSDHTGWQLQMQTNSLLADISTNWVAVSGSSTTNQVITPINVTNGSVFYRLVYPGQ